VIIALIANGVLDCVLLTKTVIHHRTGLSTFAVTVAAVIAHRARRRFVNTGRRVAPKTRKAQIA
jgi:hypothetical protein